MTGPERGEPLQSKLDKDEGAGQGMTLMKGTLTYLRMGGLLDEQSLPGTKPFATTCLDFMDCVTAKSIGSKRAKT